QLKNLPDSETTIVHVTDEFSPSEIGNNFKMVEKPLCDPTLAWTNLNVTYPGVIKFPLMNITDFLSMEVKCSSFDPLTKL
ncbi:hypothetical protein PFISCL1PPCAC_26050, partial [Pristionchus fissidentatus]